MAVALVGAALALTGCDSSQSKASTATATAESGKDGSREVDPIPVETLTVHSRDYVDTFSSFGRVEPVNSVTVSAEAGGRALSVPFEEGERIKAGSRLLRVDTQLDSARIDVLESQVDSAQREFKRTEKLAEQGLATPQRLDQAESALETAQLNLKQAKVAASKGGVRSPVSGTVQQKFVDEGEFVGPGNPIATIIDTDALKVVGNVPEAKLQFLEEGAQVDIVIPAVDAEFTGTIHRIGLDALPQTRTYPVEVRLENKEGLVRPGMHARLEFVKKHWEDVVIVPRDAILQGFSGSEAMVAPTDDKGEVHAELRHLELGPSVKAQVLVTSGLEPGEHLVVRGHRGLVDGALVRKVNHWESIEEFRNPTQRIDLSSSDDAAEGSKQ